MNFHETSLFALSFYILEDDAEYEEYNVADFKPNIVSKPGKSPHSVSFCTGYLKLNREVHCLEKKTH